MDVRDIFKGFKGGETPAPTCASCRYFEDAACKRYPPVRFTLEQTGFPTPSAEWWCGEHVRR